MRRARLAAALAAGTAGLLLAGCGSGGPRQSPATLLGDAKQVLDRTPAVHFTLSSQHLPSKGTLVVGGQGDIVRPNELSGTFRVMVSGFLLNVPVVETGGKFYARAPFASHYTVADPKKLGLGHPDELIDPAHGISALLTEARRPRSVGQVRLSGELLDEVTATVTGAQVGQFLPDKAPSTPVTMVSDVAPGSHQLRRVTLTGPFSSATQMSTYIVVLDHYGEKRTIVAPQT